MGKFIDLTGQRFGRLTVLSESERSNYGHVLWLCLCDCGNYHTVSSYRLRSGETKSCGCYRRETTGNQFRKYKNYNSRIYRIWKLMNKRCYNPNDPKYKNYGGRGIVICSEWKTDFWAFQTWALANGYDDGLSIDRIDVDGPYSPDNCRWATNTIQSNNKTDSLYLDYQGEQHTVAEWARITGIGASTLYARVRAGWSTCDILTIKPRLGNRVSKKQSQEP